jgi:hypothetical protein
MTHRPLRVLLLDPYGDDSPRGNSVAAARIAAGLRAAGCEVRRIAAMHATLTASLRQIAAWRPDVVHAMHAFRAGHLAGEIARRARIPFVLGFRGTDVTAGLEHP